MKVLKEQAIKLRLQGNSYLDIKRALGIPKSTLSGWLKDIQISESARLKINKKGNAVAIATLLKRNKLQTHYAIQRAIQTQKKSQAQIGSLSKRELFLTGVSLYWAEGHKRPINYKGRQRTYHPVSLSNSDPLLVKIFLRFLREICLVPDLKISANMRIYQHQNAQQLLQFWHKTTKIPVHKFHKFYYGVSKSSLGKRPFNILPYGTIQIVVADTKLYHTIMGWIKGLSEN